MSGVHVDSDPDTARFVRNPPTERRSPRITDRDAAVDHPSHYQAGEYECIDVIESLGLDFHLGNALKYIWRAGRKDSDEVQDLAKAAWYIQRRIDLIKRENRR